MNIILRLCKSLKTMNIINKKVGHTYLEMEVLEKKVQIDLSIQA